MLWINGWIGAKMLVARIVFIVLVCVGLFVLSVSFIKSARGKSIKGVLHVPQGKGHLAVRVCDDTHLRPFKYGQTFEALFVPGDATLTSSYTGDVERGIATISLKDKPIGLICDSNTHSLALLRLAEMHATVMVQVVVMGLESDGKPLIWVLLPDDKWFKRALTSKE